mmetsp:Transcript_12696/g.24079  ORF Transcript_12696/g.24079 Transcript_12696/m.24079 type:complete len:124 (+) Transcript_12696:1318-1689(+)
MHVLTGAMTNVLMEPTTIVGRMTDPGNGAPTAGEALPSARCETTAKMVEVVRYSKRVQVTGRVRAVLSLGPPRSAVLDAEPPASSARRTKSLSNMFSELKLRPEILVKQYGRVACRNQFPRKR